MNALSCLMEAYTCCIACATLLLLAAWSAASLATTALSASSWDWEAAVAATEEMRELMAVRRLSTSWREDEAAKLRVLRESRRLLMREETAATTAAWDWTWSRRGAMPVDFWRMTPSSALNWLSVSWVESLKAAALFLMEEMLVVMSACRPPIEVSSAAIRLSAAERDAATMRATACACASARLATASAWATLLPSNWASSRASWAPPSAEEGSR